VGGEKSNHGDYSTAVLHCQQNASCAVGRAPACVPGRSDCAAVLPNGLELSRAASRARFLLYTL